MCSFDNHPDLKKCEMCETSRESYSNISEAIGGNDDALPPYMFYPVPVFFANHPNQAMAMLDNGFFPPPNFPAHFLSAATNNPFIPVFALDNRTNGGSVANNGSVTNGGFMTNGGSVTNGGFVPCGVMSNGFVTSALRSNSSPTNHSLPINDYSTNRGFDLNDNGNSGPSDTRRSSVTTLSLSPSSCSSHTHCYCHKS